MKVLGIAGAVAAGGATLDEVRSELSTNAVEELAPIGAAIEADLSGELDADLIATGQADLAAATRALPAAAERGVPIDGQRNEFAPVEDAGRPIYQHLSEVGFFESTSEHLPEFSQSYLETAVEAFAASEALVAPFEQIGLSSEAGIDLLATVIANAAEVSDYYWLADDKITRVRLEAGDYIPPMTQMAAGGSLLWLGDIDQHNYKFAHLLTDEIVADAVWHGQSMAAGFYLMSEGAKSIAHEGSALSDGELAALLSTGFVVQAISQNLLPQDVYRITEEMRSPRRTDLRTVPYEQHSY